MLTFLEILTRLYSDKSMQELEQALDIVSNSAVAFNGESWRKIGKKDLLNEETKFRLIRTLFESQEGGEHGIIDFIFDSLEGWSKSYFLFEDFNIEEKRFYRLYYALASGINFEWLGAGRQLYLLSGPFLLMMISLDIDLYSHIQRYFSRFCFVSMLKEDQEQFLEAIEKNPTRIGTRQDGIAVSNLIADYNKYVKTNTVSNIVQGYLTSNERVKKIAESDRQTLVDVLFIYNKINSGEVWHEVNDFMCVHQSLRHDEAVAKNKSDYYLEALSEAGNIVSWLKSYNDIVRWLENEKKDFDFMRKLFGVLEKKVNLSDETQLNLLLQLVENLPAKHKQKFGNIFYFDQPSSQFKWNEEAMKK